MKSIRKLSRRFRVRPVRGKKRKPKKRKKQAELSIMESMTLAEEKQILTKAKGFTYRGRGHVIYRILISGIFLYMLVCFGMIVIPAVRCAAVGMDNGGFDKLLVRAGKFLSPLYSYAAGGEKEEDVQKAIEENRNEQQINGDTEDSVPTLDINLSGNVEVVFGEGYYEQIPLNGANLLEHNLNKINTLKRTMDYTYLLKNFYIVDGSTTAVEKNFPVQELLSKDLSLVKDTQVPQILIHHTHASETFADSRSGKQEDTAVGMGIELARILSEEYGFQVIHDKSAYDMAGGKLDRSKAYNYAEEGTLAILEEYPSIQVIIDLHRDGGKKRVTEIDGRRTAQIMFFNGLSRNANGPISYLYNPYIKDNLAFSLQLKLSAMEKYPDLTKNIYLKGYEYNLSLMPRSLLIEVGTAENTVEEGKNAMIPLAEILAEVLNGKDNSAE